MNDQTARVTIPYAPRWFQRETHENMKRFNVLVFHRRAGKTVCAINELIRQITSCTKPDPQGHYIAPFYRQVKRIAWKYVKGYTAAIPGMKYHEGDLIATFPNGGQIELLGGDNFDALRGIYSDYAILDEYAQMHPSLWGEVFRPALSDRKGGAIFIGTPKGHNYFYDKYVEAGHKPNWYRAMYKVTETGALDLEEILEAKGDMSKDEFAQEYLCSWTAAIKGAYFGEEMQELERAGRITNVPHDPALPVITSHDLGIRALWVICYWQIAGFEPRLIEVEAFTGKGIPEITKHLKSKPYNYSKHIMPHDIKVTELGSGKTRLAIFRKLGISCATAPDLSLADGIEATRVLLPKCVIDREKCKVAIEALKQYRTEYDEKRQVYKKTPLDDWTNHYADAVRMFAVTNPKRANDLFGEQDYSDVDRRAV